MGTTSGEQQLELFHIEEQAARLSRREPVGQFDVQVRHDHLMLVGISCIIGLTVVFACGVERGKQLVRAEQSLLVRQAPAPSHVSTAQQTGGSPAAQRSSSPTPLTGKPAPALTGKSRYAVQVVTFTRVQLARQELQRLQARGERAFLMKREGRMVVYVGPFPSHTHANQKLTMLKTRYQDCFVKTL